MPRNEYGDDPSVAADVDPAAVLASGRTITRNSMLNMAGYGAPILIAVVTIPVIIHAMGTARFGILTLAWAIIGYFSLFDFGLNHALTKLVSERLGSGKTGEIPNLIVTSLAIMGIIGCIVAAVMALMVPSLVEHLASIPAEMKNETRLTFYLLAASVPLVIVSVGLRGVLSAYQKFDLVNWVRVPMGIYFFVVPIPIVKWYMNALHPVMLALIAGRLIAMLIQLRFCSQIVPFLRPGVAFQRDLIRPLLTFGGWMTVTNLISPLMIYMDRFFIGVLLSASAVAFYATPNEIATKMWFLPWALLGVLFPAFSTSLAKRSQMASEIYDNSVKYLFIVMFPIALLVITFAYEGLDIWVGREFAVQSSPVLKWMVVGVFIHSLAQVPYALLQGGGRPDIIAKLHMLELPLYAVVLWQLIGLWGTQGAAVAWTVRLGIDALMVFFLAPRVIPAAAVKAVPKLVLLAAAIGAFYLIAQTETMIVRLICCLVILTAFAGVVWFLIFSDQDRERIHKRIIHAA